MSMMPIKPAQCCPAQCKTAHEFLGTSMHIPVFRRLGLGREPEGRGLDFFFYIQPAEQLFNDHLHLL